MLCFEVYKNGTKLCTAGNKNIYGLLTKLHYVKDANWFKLNTTGFVKESEKLDNSVEWHKSETIDLNDEILIKVVESENPDNYRVIKHYGTLEENNNIKHFCSFCGREASKDLGMYIGFSKANICYECLAKVNSAVNESNNA